LSHQFRNAILGCGLAGARFLAGIDASRIMSAVGSSGIAIVGLHQAIRNCDQAKNDQRAAHYCDFEGPPSPARPAGLSQQLARFGAHVLRKWLHASGHAGDSDGNGILL
jgi:hypothetical protein